MTEHKHLHAPIELIQYLYARLFQLGVHSIYGHACDTTNPIAQATSSAEITYTRSMNEAHAAYAADAYARVKGLAALISTHGPNEPTTNHMLFHAHAEHIPIVHVVGYASASAARDRDRDRDRDVLRKLLRQVQVGSIDQAVAYSSVVVLGVFNHIADAPQRIDDALSDCLMSGRPVYIGVPMAYAKSLVEGGVLERRPVLRGVARNNPLREEHVAEVILRYLNDAEDPVVVVDGGVIRQGIQDVVQEFVDRSRLPTFVTLEGREALDRSRPNHGGLYAGLQSTTSIKDRVHGSDLLIHIGPSKFHVNAQYLHYLRFRNKIEIHVDEHLVGRTMSYGLISRGLIKAVISRLDEITLPSSSLPLRLNKDMADPLDRIGVSTTPDDHDSEHGDFTKNDVYPPILQWMRDGDYLINHFPIGDAQNWVRHAIWERKDVAFGACLGAALASREMGSARRVLVFVDALYPQHAALELQVILRSGLKPIVFMAREAPVTEAEPDYDEDSDEAPYHPEYSLIAELDLHGNYRVSHVQTRCQLARFLASEQASSPSCLQIVELVLNRVIDGHLQTIKCDGD